MEITKQASIKFITNRFYKTKRVPRKLKKKIKKRLTFALNYFDGYYNFQDGYFTGVSDFKLKDH